MSLIQERKSKFLHVNRFFTQGSVFLYVKDCWFALSVIIIVVNSNKVVTKVAVLKCLGFFLVKVKAKFKKTSYFLQEWLQQLNRNIGE